MSNSNSNESTPSSSVQAGSTNFKRRGLIAGAAALATAALARLGARPALANDGDSLLVGRTTLAASTTVLQRTAGVPGSFAFVVATPQNSGGAINASAPNGDGIRADSGTGTALGGNSTSGTGLIGSSGSAIGVYGNTTTGTTGVRGDATTGAGVAGNATTGIAISGFSATGTAIAGSTTSGVAGQFSGPVVVNGSFTATGIKSTVVPHPDGSMRRLYCLESPESYFEDFGEGRLQNGSADIRLDPDFAQIVRSERYMVFLTEYGDAGGLYISARSADGFRVAARNGRSEVGFGYRVVARRRDVTVDRLERVVLPTLEINPPTPVAGLERLLNSDA